MKELINLKEMLDRKEIKLANALSKFDSNTEIKDNNIKKLRDEIKALKNLIKTKEQNTVDLREIKHVKELTQTIKDYQEEKDKLNKQLEELKLNYKSVKELFEAEEYQLKQKLKELDDKLKIDMKYSNMMIIFEVEAVVNNRFTDGQGRLLI